MSYYAIGIFQRGIKMPKTTEQAMRAAWRETVKRCTSEAHPQYPYYGGRGVTVCPRWQVFPNFLQDMGLRPEGMTLERRDNSKGYSPENCRWASRAEQTRNRRVTIFLTHRRCTRTLVEWANATGISYTTLKARVRAGYSPKEVLTKPVKCGQKLPGRQYAPRRKPDMSRCPRGGSSARAKLTDEQAVTIRRRAAAGETLTALGREYGVSVSAVSFLIHRKTFKHV